jgi:hypothetical protein
MVNVGTPMPHRLKERLSAGLGRKLINSACSKLVASRAIHRPVRPARVFSLKVVNDEDVPSLYIRPRRKPWRKIVSYEVSGYNQNMADGFMSLRPALFASGAGTEKSKISFIAVGKSRLRRGDRFRTVSPDAARTYSATSGANVVVSQ